MWDQYRRTFIPTQLFVLAACVTVYFTTGRQWFLPLVVFATMQVGFALGAAYTARVARKLSSRKSREDPLPLQRHR